VPVSYSSPDLLAVISAVYVCDCGKQTCESGRHVGDLPAGWVAAGNDRYVCPYCVEQGWHVNPPPRRTA
jgi:hypothetical protein